MQSLDFYYSPQRSERLFWKLIHYQGRQHVYPYNMGDKTAWYFKQTLCILISSLNNEDGRSGVFIIHPVRLHYREVIMGRMASQITGLTFVYSTVNSGADQRKRQSSASLAFVRGIHRWPVNSPHKWPSTRKMFPFDVFIPPPLPTYPPTVPPTHPPTVPPTHPPTVPPYPPTHRTPPSPPGPPTTDDWGSLGFQLQISYTHSLCHRFDFRGYKSHFVFF